MTKEEKKIAKKAYKLLDNSILYSPRQPLRIEQNWKEKRRALEERENK